MGWICETIVMWSGLCHNWHRAGIGIPLSDQAGALVFSHAIWADNVIFGASSTDQPIMRCRCWCTPEGTRGSPALSSICSAGSRALLRCPSCWTSRSLPPLAPECGHVFQL
eukprot:1814722-Pyramimonas_sp.AAC.2